MVIVAGKLLIEADFAGRAADAGAKVIPAAVQLIGDRKTTLSSDTDVMVSTLNVPAHAESHTASEQTTLSDEEQKPARTLEREPQRTAAEITPEQIRALVDRGDALVSMTDVTSAPLFYEGQLRSEMRRPQFDWEQVTTLFSWPRPAS